MSYPRESDPFDLPETMAPTVPLHDSDEVGYVNQDDPDNPPEEPRGEDPRW